MPSSIRQAVLQVQDMTSRRVKYKNFVDELQKGKNRVKARVCAKVEHPFRILKPVFGFAKVGYRGLKKKSEGLRTCFAQVICICTGNGLQSVGGSMSAIRAPGEFSGR
jgi:IS5 family transposase